ncbi:MAG: serine hydrolase [Bacteroidota bacterium]
MKKIVSLSLALLGLLYCGLGQTGSQVDYKELSAYYEKMVQDWDVPAMSVGIVKDGALVFFGNYGVLEVGKPQKPDKNTLYAIASNSKAFTSAILGMLVQEGKLDWDDPVQKYLPYFEVYDPWVSQHVTIRDLLCHRVGYGTFSGDVIWYKSDLTSEEIIRRFRHLPKAFDFRSDFGYSNLMYITAGEVIKKVTGKPWSQNVREKILVPLGMDRTLTSPKDLETKGNYVTPHGRENERNFPIAWEDWEEIGATGGLISSVADISKWMIFNLNHGIHGRDTLLSVKTRNLVWTPHNNFVINHTEENEWNRHFSGYGLGWGLSDYHGRLRVAHTGGYDGMITAVTLIPDENLGVVVLTNGMKSPITPATYCALDRFLGLEKKDWSAESLARFEKRQKEDPRITHIKEKRILNTKPSLPLSGYVGAYRSDIYGEIRISDQNGKLRMQFEHTPDLSATLSHWHYDVWEIQWDKKQAWFNFGTVGFTTNNNQEVKGMEFEVPNNDIFFEELKPYKVASSQK